MLLDYNGFDTVNGKGESDVTKQDIGRITEIQLQAILQKREGAPQTTRLGTEKGYVEDEGGVYLETINEKGVQR